MKNEKQKHKLDYTETDALAADITGADPDDATDIDLKLYEKYDISQEQYHKIVEDIFDRLNFGVSPLSLEAYAGLLTKDKKLWLVKKNVHQEFINSVITWMTEDEEVKTGFRRDILKESGEVEFILTIRKPIEGADADKPKKTRKVKPSKSAS